MAKISDNDAIIMGNWLAGGGGKVQMTQPGRDSTADPGGNYNFTQQGGRVVYQKSGLGGGGNMAGGNKDIEKLLKKLLKQLNKGSDEAKTKGEEQYAALLDSLAGLKEGVLGGTLGRAEQSLGQIFASDRQRVQDMKTAASGAARQDLVSRGLGNTTVVDAVERGIASDAEAAMRAISGSEAQQALGLFTGKAGLQTQIGGMEADAILSRDIRGPDTAQYLALLQQLGQYA
jgi:hypothetical protein